MLLKSNLQAKILVYTLGIVLFVFFFIGLFVGVKNKNFAIERAHEYTQLMADKNASEIKSIFNEYVGFLNANSKNISHLIKSNNTASSDFPKGFLNTILKENSHIESAWIALSNNALNNDVNSSLDWTIFKTSENTSLIKIENQTQIDAHLLKYSSANSTSVSEPYSKESKRLIEIYSPIFNGSKKIGYVGFSLNLDLFSNFISNAYIYEGGFITVLSNSAVFVGHSNQGFLGKTFSQNFPEEDEKWSVEKKVSKGNRFEIRTKFDKSSYYSFFAPVNITESIPPWMVEVTVPMHTILETSEKSIRTSIYVALIGFLLMILVIYLITNAVIAPIKKVTEILDLLSKGNLKDIENLTIKTSDELQEMGQNLNQVVNGLKKTESFALEIGNGNLENEYNLLSDADQLGKALIDMRISLKKNIEEDEKRKIEEEHITWATHGIAKFGEILRQDNTDMKKLGYNILSNLVNYLDVNQGALFVLNEDIEDDPYFELINAIAFGRDKFMKKEIKIGEGLVGRCAHERKTIFLKEIPENYATITSGLGDAKPGCILIVPCILNESVYGVIELASFTPLKTYEIDFVEKLGESIGATISSVRINLKTSTLLRASQHQSDELASQEEELRQNLEEMEATQEDLKRQMETNIEMRKNLSKQSALLDSLLNSLPDYIYFKDADSKFLKISKSMLSLFGASSVEEVIGKSDFDYHSPENAQKYYDDEQNIIRSKEGIMNQIQHELKADGTKIWTSVTKLPLITLEGECIGTFGISKDVSDIKNIELEAQKQKDLLDALLNALPDFIYFKDKESKFLRISKSMISLFGATNVNEVIGKSDFDFQTPENAQKYYEDEQKIITSRQGITDQLQEETMPDGTMIWNSVTKLPLISSDDECVGTFGISKDVTDLKELELKTAKQKIELFGILEAIKNSTYTIEYDPKGYITDMNDGMLKLLNLKKENIIGTHHKEGIDKSKFTDKEYKIFWEELLNGNIKRIENKILINKKEIWLSETYTPIIDENSAVYKILKIAFDITSYHNKK